MKLFIFVGIILIILAILCVIALIQMFSQVPKEEKGGFFWSTIACIVSLFLILSIVACICFNTAKEHKVNKVDSTYIILNENAEKPCDE